MEQPKVFIFSFPAAGHMNTILSMTKELVSREKCKVVFYSSNESKAQIERAGATFRSYDNNFSFFGTNFVMPQFKNKMKVSLMELIQNIQNFTNKSVARIARDINDEKPVLVIYDHFSVYAKWALRLIRANYHGEIRTRNFLVTTDAPLEIMYFTSFASCGNINPHSIKKRCLRLDLFSLLKFFFNTVYVFVKQFIFCHKLKLKFENPITDLMSSPSENLNLVFVSPSLQPQSHLFDKKFRFVGSCIDDEVHHDGQYNRNQETIQKLLDLYPARNPIDNVDKLQNDKRKLIYFSLGSLHNGNTDLILKAVDCFMKFNESKQPSEYKFEQIDVIISLSKTSKHEIEAKELNIPNNIHLIDGVPQLEVLKRASLFITHAGMNSISESIHYGVPVICIPLTADQPQNSHRVTKELGLGIELPFINLKSEQLREAVVQVINDPSYQKRACDQSRASREYVGQKLAVDAILEYLKIN